MPHISRSYGTDYLDLSRRAAYVGKIFWPTRCYVSPITCWLMGRHIANWAATQRLTRRAIRLLEGQGYRVTLQPAA
jgi:hypothetical protein